MSENFKVFVGDDTGLIKNVRMNYKYQVDIIGSHMSKVVEEDLNEGEDEIFD